MNLVVGLGNPGRKYKDTRHNAGFMVVDKMAGNEEWKESKTGRLLYLWINKNTELIKPQTFMNESGESVLATKKKHQNLEIQNIYVVHDDLDISLGTYKIQKGKGPKDHKGLNSIYKRLGTKDFWHVRIGVNNRSKGNNISGEDYVLQKFDDDEREVILKVVGEVIEKISNDFF